MSQMQVGMIKCFNRFVISKIRLHLTLRLRFLMIANVSDYVLRTHKLSFHNLQHYCGKILLQVYFHYLNYGDTAQDRGHELVNILDEICVIVCPTC